MSGVSIREKASRMPNACFEGWLEVQLPNEHLFLSVCACCSRDALGDACKHCRSSFRRA